MRWVAEGFDRRTDSLAEVILLQPAFSEAEIVELLGDPAEPLSGGWPMTSALAEAISRRLQISLNLAQYEYFAECEQDPTSEAQPS